MEILQKARVSQVALLARPPALLVLLGLDRAVVDQHIAHLSHKLPWCARREFTKRTASRGTLNVYSRISTRREQGAERWKVGTARQKLRKSRRSFNCVCWRQLLTWLLPRWWRIREPLAGFACAHVVVWERFVVDILRVHWRMLGL